MIMVASVATGQSLEGGRQSAPITPSPSSLRKQGNQLPIRSILSAIKTLLTYKPHQIKNPIAKQKYCTNPKLPVIKSKKKIQSPENPPGSGKTHRPSRSPALGGVNFNPLLPFSDMHEKKTLLCHALPSPRFRITKDRSPRAGTGKIEKRGVMSERVLADDFLKWECEGEGGDGYVCTDE